MSKLVCSLAWFASFLESSLIVNICLVFPLPDLYADCVCGISLSMWQMARIFLRKESSMTCRRLEAGHFLFPGFRRGGGKNNELIKRGKLPVTTICFSIDPK